MSASLMPNEIHIFTQPCMPICVPSDEDHHQQQHQHQDERSRVVVGCLTSNNTKDIGHGGMVQSSDLVQQHQHHHSPPTTATTDHSTYSLKNICVGGAQTNNQGGMMKSPDEDIIGMGEQKQHQHHVKQNLRPHSTPATLLWLEENYETAEGVCIPRSTLYMHYVDFCDRNGMQPVNAASFGKIIRQQFPHLTTRRLGTRGQSRYHYYGIAVKESSPYYDVSYSKRGGSSLHETKKEPLKQAATYSQRTKIGALLPDFTHFKDLNLPPNIPEEKISTFLMMYRTHCQRILDTVIRASFDEVQSFLLHFWKGMPTHIASILGTNALVNVVGVCDSFVYKAISNVLFPSVHQTLPDSLVQLIRKFSKELTVWLRMALDDVPENLRELKLDLAKCFSRTLRRQTSLNHLCQASRMVIHNADITGQMLHDWRHVDMDGVSRQTLFTVHDGGLAASASTEMDSSVGNGGTGATVELITSLYKEFETLLEDQAPIEAYMEWLDSLIERCVVQPSRKRKSSIRRLARQFLLMWSCFGTRVIRDMTLHSAPSFGSFHLLHLTFDDYVLFLVESVHWEERTQELFANIPNDAPPLLNDSMIDDTIVDSEVGMCKLKWFNPQSHGASVSNHVISTSGTASLPNASPSSHSHASSSDVITQNSPGQGALESNMTMDEDVKPAETDADESEPLIADYTPMNADQYPSTYHYQTQDARSIYAYNAGVPSGRHVESRNTYTPCHPGNQYIMSNPVVETQQVVDCGGSRNLVPVNPSRSTGDSVINGNVEYANFVQYPTAGRRGDYTDCHGYTYEQAPQQQQQQQQQQQSLPPPPPPPPAPSIIYTPTNCYYQPYDSNATTVGSGSTSLGCCSPRYSVSARSDDASSPGKLERLQEPKLQQEGMSGLSSYSASANNGRG